MYSPRAYRSHLPQSLYFKAGPDDIKLADEVTLLFFNSSHARWSPCRRQTLTYPISQDRSDVRNVDIFGPQVKHPRFLSWSCYYLISFRFSGPEEMLFFSRAPCRAASAVHPFGAPVLSPPLVPFTCVPVPLSFFWHKEREERCFTLVGASAPVAAVHRSL